MFRIHWKPIKSGRESNVPEKFYGSLKKINNMTLSRYEQGTKAGSFFNIFITYAVQQITMRCLKFLGKNSIGKLPHFDYLGYHKH
jgi:hypothetical protein